MSTVENVTFKITTVMATNGTSVGKIGLPFIETSGHTEFTSANKI